MIVAGLIFAAAAALIHIFIFYLESIAWESERARATFGTSTVEEARVTKFMAYNQGFYNLFLALLASIGIIVWVAGPSTIGLTLVLAGTGSMLAAATVLFCSSAAHRLAAVEQGVLPLAAVVLLSLGLAL